MSESWCILRCSGRSTLGLARSLAEDGFKVWTPVGLPDQAFRRPRSRSRKRVDPGEMVPILPSYVFAAETHFEDLLDLAHRRFFSLMADKLCRRGFAFIADRSLDRFRAMEANAATRVPRDPVEPLEAGKTIKVPAGVAGYDGLSGIVESSDGKRTWLDFGGIMGRVQIETFRLRPEARVAA